jgi:hypothetical protein
MPSTLEVSKNDNATVGQDTRSGGSGATRMLVGAAFGIALILGSGFVYNTLLGAGLSPISAMALGSIAVGVLTALSIALVWTVKRLLVSEKVLVNSSESLDAAQERQRHLKDLTIRVQDPELLHKALTLGATRTVTIQHFDFAAGSDLGKLQRLSARSLVLQGCSGLGMDALRRLISAMPPGSRMFIESTDDLEGDDDYRLLYRVASNVGVELIFGSDSCTDIRNSFHA